MAHFDDVLFYSLGWALAALCGLLVTYHSDSCRPVVQLMATGALCGMVAVSILCVLVGSLGSVNDRHPYYLGIAIAVGLLGEAALKLPVYVLKTTLKRVGIELDDESETDDR